MSYYTHIVSWRSFHSSVGIQSPFLYATAYTPFCRYTIVSTCPSKMNQSFDTTNNDTKK